jgi:hypothetical protein
MTMNWTEIWSILRNCNLPANFVNSTSALYDNINITIKIESKTEYGTHTTASRTALGPTQSPIQWVSGSLSLRVKRPEREADHSPPSSAEVKEWVKLYLHSSNTPQWRRAHLKGQGHLYLYLLYGNHLMVNRVLKQDVDSPRYYSIYI